jgi:hypothetical protein
MKHIKLFEQFIQNLETKQYDFSIRESFTYADAIDNTGEDYDQEVKGIKNALKSLRAKSVEDITILVDTTEDDGGFLYDEIKKMKPINIDSLIYDKAYSGKIDGKNVVVFDSAGDLFAYVKESYVFENAIENPITIEHLEVAPIDSLIGVSFYDAVAYIKKLGDGWRLPTIKEFDILAKNRRALKFKSQDYWTSEYSNNNYKISFPNTNGDNHSWIYEIRKGRAVIMFDRDTKVGVRLVKGPIVSYGKPKYDEKGRSDNLIYEF